MNFEYFFPYPDTFTPAYYRPAISFNLLEFSAKELWQFLRNQHPLINMLMYAERCSELQSVHALYMRYLGRTHEVSTTCWLQLINAYRVTE